MMYRLRGKKVNLEKKMLALVLERWYSLALSQQPTPMRARECLINIDCEFVSQERSAVVLTPAGHYAKAQRAPSKSPERANLNKVSFSKTSRGFTRA